MLTIQRVPKARQRVRVMRKLHIRAWKRLWRLLCAILHTSWAILCTGLALPWSIACYALVWLRHRGVNILARKLGVWVLALFAREKYKKLMGIRAARQRANEAFQVALEDFFTKVKEDERPIEMVREFAGVPAPRNRDQRKILKDRLKSFNYQEIPATHTAQVFNTFRCRKFYDGCPPTQQTEWYQELVLRVWEKSYNERDIFPLNEALVMLVKEYNHVPEASPLAELVKRLCAMKIAQEHPKPAELKFSEKGRQALASKPSSHAFMKFWEDLRAEVAKPRPLGDLSELTLFPEMLGVGGSNKLELR